MNWNIDWYVCRADQGDVDFAKKEKLKIKVGDELWRVARGISPISTDTDHWAGAHLTLSKEQAEFVSAACAAYEAVGNKWPEKS